MALPPPPPPRARSSSISPTPRKRYTVALGEPIMKPHTSTSPSPISVGDDDTEEDDEEEVVAVDRTIGRSSGRYTTAQQNQRRNGLGIGIGNRNGGGGGGDDTDTSASDWAPDPRTPPRLVRPRAHTQSSPSPSDPPRVATAASRTNPLRVHGRALSTGRVALRDPRPPRSATVAVAGAAGAGAGAAGFRDPLVVRREETEARAKTAQPPPKVFAGRPRAPVGELVAYFDKS